MLRALLAWALLLGALAPRPARGGRVVDSCVGWAVARASVDVAARVRTSRDVVAPAVDADATAGLPPRPITLTRPARWSFELSFVDAVARAAVARAPSPAARSPPLLAAVST